MRGSGAIQDKTPFEKGTACGGGPLPESALFRGLDRGPPTSNSNTRALTSGGKGKRCNVWNHTMAMFENHG